MEIPQLSSEPVPQIAWYLQNKDDLSEGKRPIDKMTTKEISKMYEQRKFLCDFCGNEIGKCNFDLREHILHLINPMKLWSCEDCYQNSLRNGTIIAKGTGPTSERWQAENR